MIRHKNSYYWLAQLGGWGFYVLLYSFYYYSINYYYSDYPYYFHTVFCEAITGFLISHLLRTVIHESRLLNLGINLQIFWMMILTLLFSVLYSAVVVTIETMMGWEPEYFIGTTFSYKLTRTTLGAGLFFTIWSLLYLAYHFAQKTQAERLNQVKLKTTVKELELKTLKAHINPHFIFNALNSIRALIDEDPVRARKAITELSYLLRSSMSSDKMEFVPLQKELDIVNNYLALEQIRFEDRLQVKWQIDETTLNQPVPPMMLQTLVENAIKHGISNSTDGGEIEIISKYANHHHELVVKNSGQPYLPGNTGGFGLSSTQQRLKWLYGEEASFEIFNNDHKQVEVKIQMPAVTYPTKITNYATNH